MIIFIACLSTSSSSCDHFVSERGWGDWYSGEHIDNPRPLHKGDNRDEGNIFLAFQDRPQDALE